MPVMIYYVKMDIIKLLKERYVKEFKELKNNL